MRSITYIFFFFLSSHWFALSQPIAALPEMTDFPNVRDWAMTWSMDEAYCTVQSILGERSVIVRLTKKDGNWGNPEITPFSGAWNDLEPFLTHDGLRLYFASNRPNKNGEATNFDLWYVERKSTKDAWSEPINLGKTANSAGNEFYPSLAKNGNLYFTSDGEGTKGKDDIFFSEWNGRKFSEPVSLSEQINSPGFEFNAFVSGDESYLIFTAYQRKDGLGSGDLYISFRDENGTWSKAKNMGEAFNSPAMDYCPMVLGTELHFTSRRSSINNSNELQSIDQLKEEVNQYENGMSRIYRADFSPKQFNQ